jgi:L-fucose isomerase-like protein
MINLKAKAVHFKVCRNYLNQNIKIMDQKEFKKKIDNARVNQITFNAEMQKLKEDLFEEIKESLGIDSKLSTIDNINKNKQVLKRNFLAVRLHVAKKFAKGEISIDDFKNSVSFD